MQSRLVGLVLGVLATLGLAPPAAAQCPYSSVQIRVQINTSTPWATFTHAAYDASTGQNKSIHIGAFRNGWGVPVDPNTVTVYALQGSYYQILPLSGWETNWRPSVPMLNDTWRFEVWCGGSFKDAASATWSGSLDVLSYVLPNWPSSNTGSPRTIITDKTNNWRTYANAGGGVGERLNGFFITKGGIDWNYSATVMWNFEQMIYDSQWIYLVRDTSWTDRCLDNNHLAGQLLFTYENNQWLRGGRHFPRSVNNGRSRDTGLKWIQGVQRAENMGDTSGEGRWCDTPHDSVGVGQVSSTVQGEWIGRKTLGDRTFDDVLSLKIVDGSGAGDDWWFAKGFGLVRFTDGSQTERYDSNNPNYPITVRIPCTTTYP